MTIRVVDEKEVMMILAIMMAFLSGGLIKEFISLSLDQIMRLVAFILLVALLTYLIHTCLPRLKKK